MKLIIIMLFFTSCTTLSPNYNKNHSHNDSLKNRNKEVMRFTRGMVKHTSKTRKKAISKKYKKNKIKHVKRFIK